MDILIFLLIALLIIGGLLGFAALCGNLLNTIFNPPRK